MCEGVLLSRLDFRVPFPDSSTCDVTCLASVRPLRTAQSVASSSHSFLSLIY